jgi:hypothetical protein
MSGQVIYFTRTIIYAHKCAYNFCKNLYKFLRLYLLLLLSVIVIIFIIYYYFYINSRTIVQTRDTKTSAPYGPCKRNLLNIQTIFAQVLTYLTIHLYFIQALLMFSISLKMIKIDRNMSELWHIVYKEYSFNVSAFVGLL